jgi:hypothetical protein
MGNESTSSRIDLFEFLPASSHQFQNKEEPIALLGPKNHGPWNVFFQNESSFRGSINWIPQKWMVYIF